MGTTTVTNLTAIISANNTKFKKGINDSKKTLGGFQKSVNMIGPAIAAAFSVAAIKSFVSASVKAYDTQIKAEKQLLTALRAREISQQRLIRQAQQLQKETLFGDEETIKAQALIAAFVKEADQIERVIPLVQDLAAAKNMDLAAAADLVSKTLGSSTNALARYGIQVEGSVGSVERLESLVTALNDAFGGQAKAAAEVDSVFTQLKNSYGDLQESIIAFSSQQGRFGVTATLKGKIEDLTEYLNERTNPELKKAQANAEAFINSIAAEGKENQIKAISDEIKKQTDLLNDRRGVYKYYENEIDNLRGKEKRNTKEFLEEEKSRIAVLFKTVKILEQEILALENFEVAESEVVEVVEKVNETLEAQIKADQELRHETIRLGMALTSDLKPAIDGMAEAWSYAFDLMDMNDEPPIDEPELNALLQRIDTIKDAYSDMGQQIKMLMTNIASDAAFGFGMAISGAESFADVLRDLGVQILASLGDILISAGVTMGPAGLPLILAGLVMKFGAGLLRGSGNIAPSQEMGYNPASQLNYSRGSGSVLYGNDIRNSNNYYTGLYNRVG
jgi:hypothetical protein